MFGNDVGTSAEATGRTESVRNRTHEHINLGCLEGNYQTISTSKSDKKRTGTL